MRYYGTLVAGKQITLSGYTLLESPLSLSLTDGRVFFTQALMFPPKNDSDNIPENSILYSKNNGNGQLVGDSVSIYFPNPGDYRCTTDYYNGTAIYQSTPKEGVIEIHVEPESTLLAAKFNRVNLGLSFAFVYFGFLEALYLWIDHRKKRKDKQAELIVKIDDLVKKLDLIVKKNTQRQDSNTDKTKKKHHF